jgi:hypothetical protein
MLRSLKDLTRYDVDAADTSCGTVHDFYFDDGEWVVCYLIVDTRKWLPGRKSLISPTAVATAHWQSRRLGLELTAAEIESAPEADTEPPVSRQMEQLLAVHYHSPPYWRGTLPTTHPPPSPTEMAPPARMLENLGNRRLRSFCEVRGYRIEAVDGSIGRLDDLIVDTDRWFIRYAVVDTGNWLLNRPVLVALGWIERIDWSASTVRVDLAKEKIADSPVFDPLEPVNRDYEKRLYDFYGRPYDWS